MNRSLIVVTMTTVILLAAACGNNEETSQPIATPVAIYTIAPSRGSQAVAQGATAEATATAEPAEATPTVKPILEPTLESIVEPTVEPVVLVPTPEIDDTDGGDADAAPETSVEIDAAAADEEAEPVEAPAEETPVELVTTAPLTATTNASAAETIVGETPEAEATQSTVAAPDTTETAIEAAAPLATAEPEQPVDAAEAGEAVEPETDAGVSEDGTGEATAETDLYAGLPAEIAALMPDADPAHGEQLSLQNACIGCHNLDPDLVMAGPTWNNVATTAETRVEGQNAAEYLYTSIVNPNDHVVEGYAANIMIPTYGETLSEQDQADLVAYLLTLHE